jgi:putative transposase
MERVSASPVGLFVSVDLFYRYQPDKKRDDTVIEALQAVVVRYPDYGFRKLFKYCLLNLNKRRRGKRRLLSRYPEP